MSGAVATPEAVDSQGMNYLVSLPRRHVAIYLPLSVFVIVLLFPFYWMTITALKRSENVKDPIDMGFRVESVTFAGQTYAMSATVTAEAIDHVRNEPTSKDVQKVVGGALVGAIAGKLIGKSTTGAVVGGAAGAAAGAGVAATTANFEGCIAEGSDMTVKLTAPVVIK